MTHLAKDCRPAQQEAGITTLGLIDTAQGGDDDDVFLALRRMEGEREAKRGDRREAAVSATTAAVGGLRASSSLVFGISARSRGSEIVDLNDEVVLAGASAADFASAKLGVAVPGLSTKKVKKIVKF